MEIAIAMRTVQMTIDEALLGSVDGVIAELGTTRSAFIREALEAALRKHEIRQKLQRHKEGYLRTPQAADDFEFTDADRVWPDW